MAKRETTCFIPGREDMQLLGASSSRGWAPVDANAPDWVKNWIIEHRKATLNGIETRSIDDRHAALRRGESRSMPQHVRTEEIRPRVRPPAKTPVHKHAWNKTENREMTLPEMLEESARLLAKFDAVAGTPIERSRSAAEIRRSKDLLSILLN